MGATLSAPLVGPKSSLDEGKDNKSGELKQVDYKDPANSSKAKEELYTLFLEGKIVQVSQVEELEAKLKEVISANNKLRARIQSEEVQRNMEPSRPPNSIGSRRSGSMRPSSHRVESRRVPAGSEGSINHQ